MFCKKFHGSLDHIYAGLEDVHGFGFCADFVVLMAFFQEAFAAAAAIFWQRRLCGEFPRWRKYYHRGFDAGLAC